MNQRSGRNNLLWIVQAVIVTAGCFTINLEGAWMGGPADLTQLLMTAGYILFWVPFSFCTRKESAPVWITVAISALTAIGAVSSFVMRLLGGGFVVAAGLSTFASVPFYGLRFWMDWTALYAVVSVLSLLWVLYAFRNLHFVRKSGSSK